MPLPNSSRNAEFAELLTRDQSRLFAYLHSLVRNLDDAEDLMQQTAVILWKKFAEFDRSRSFIAWACGIARFEAMNFLRSRSREKLYFSDDLNLLLIETIEKIPHDEFEERRQALSGCVEKLRSRDREILRHHYSNSQPVSEVAVEQGRSPQSIHNSLRRIRKTLHDCVTRSLKNLGGGTIR
jgi:RNA polymerase sigma-70 factor, ECF subfamily